MIEPLQLLRRAQDEVQRLGSSQSRNFYSGATQNRAVANLIAASFDPVHRSTPPASQGTLSPGCVPPGHPDTVSESTIRDAMRDPHYSTGDCSSGESNLLRGTSACLMQNLHPLQTKRPDSSDLQALEPLKSDDPLSFNLVEPSHEVANVGINTLEKQSEMLFSSEHLSGIFADPRPLLKFTGFLSSHRPQSIPLLNYYLDALKALRAIKYANAVANALEPIKECNFTEGTLKQTCNAVLEEKVCNIEGFVVQEYLTCNSTMRNLRMHCYLLPSGLQVTELPCLHSCIARIDRAQPLTCSANARGHSTSS